MLNHTQKLKQKKKGGGGLFVNEKVGGGGGGGNQPSSNITFLQKQNIGYGGPNVMKEKNRTVGGVAGRTKW